MDRLLRTLLWAAVGCLVLAPAARAEDGGRGRGRMGGPMRQDRPEVKVDKKEAKWQDDRATDVREARCSRCGQRCPMCEARAGMGMRGPVGPGPFAAGRAGPDVRGRDELGKRLEALIAEFRELVRQHMAERGEPRRPELVRPEIRRPGLPGLGLRRPGLPQPELRRPEPPRMELRRPEPPKPELRRPELPKPELRRPEPPKPELRRPEPPRPELRRPEPPRPELRMPEPPRPEARRPEGLTPAEQRQVQKIQELLRAYQEAVRGAGPDERRELQRKLLKDIRDAAEAARGEAPPPRRMGDDFRGRGRDRDD